MSRRERCVFGVLEDASQIACKAGGYSCQKRKMGLLGVADISRYNAALRKVVTGAAVLDEHHSAGRFRQSTDSSIQ